MKTALVTGGTGQIGMFLLPRLLERGWRIIAPTRRVHPGESRRPAGSDGRLEWVNPGDYARNCAAGDAEATHALVSTGPVALAAGLAKQCPDLERVVCFSSSSVLVKAGSRVAWERGQMRALIDAEDGLREACHARSVPLWLFRPTLIYGCGLDRNVSLIAHLAQRFHVLPVAGRASGLRSPVHAEDLAGLACRALEADPDEAVESPVTGGEELAYREMVNRVLEATGTTPRLFPLPTFLLAGAAALLGRVFGMRNLNAGMIRRQNTDLLFDDAVVRARLGWDPRPFRPAAGDFRLSEAARALLP